MRLYHREKDFVRLLESTRNSFTDVELRGPEYGSTVRAHRAHLAHFSPFLRNLFRDPDRRNEPIITLLLDPSVHFPSVVTLLRLLYTGSIQEVLDGESLSRLEETSRLLGFRLPGLSSSSSSSEVILKEVQNFRCIGCQGAFHSLSQLESHSASCRPSLDFIPRRKKPSPDPHPPVTPIYECPLCGNKYSNMSTLRFHLASHCRKQIMERVERIMKNNDGICPICHAAYRPRTSSIIWHFGVVHHYVKDFLHPDVFRQFFASAGSRTRDVIPPEELIENTRSSPPPPPLPPPQQPPVVVESIRKRTYVPSNSSDKLECPLCMGNFVDIHSLRKHFVRHFRDQIKEKIRKISNDPENCVICAAHIPKCSLNHYGVSHHFVKDYLDSSIYERYFSSHPNFKRQKLQLQQQRERQAAAAVHRITPEESYLGGEDGGDYEVKSEDEEGSPPTRGRMDIRNHQDKLAIVLAEEGLALDVKKRGCYCFPCPICQKGEYVICELRLHMASHYRREIMEKVSGLTDDRSKCALCSAAVPRSLLRHYGVVHHFVKDFMEESMYLKYFSTHPNFSNPEAREDEEYVGEEEEDELLELEDEEEEVPLEEYEDSRIFETDEEIFDAGDETDLNASGGGFTWDKDAPENPLYPEVLINTEADPFKE